MADDEDITGLAHECDGGWVQVSAKYAEHLFPNDPEKRAAAAGSVYPCKVCRATQFFRWVKGHYSKDHEPGACDECRRALHLPAAKATA